MEGVGNLLKRLIFDDGRRRVFFQEILISKRMERLGILVRSSRVT